MPILPSSEVEHRLRSFGQLHLLDGWKDLSEDNQSTYVRQLASIDFAELAHLTKLGQTKAVISDSAVDLAPMSIEQQNPLSRAVGEAALRAGQVAVLLVAGGQGTRLGFDHPKGMYPVGPVSGASLFQIHAEKVLALSRKSGKPVPFLVMTSRATHTATVEFFQSNKFFGLSINQVRFFQQGEMPAVDMATGKVLLEAPGQVALSPNGHGGTLTALAETGLLAELKTKGVHHVFYFQVDNAMVNIADPVFIGQHIEANSDASSKAVLKTRPDEKVGLLAIVNKRCGIIEYSDLPVEMNNARDADGQLTYRAGNPAIHCFSVPFLERVTSGAERLSYHIARKKVPYYDVTSGKVITPTAENAYKFELFIFDALPLAERFLVVETKREDEFAPLKNASGPDSLATVQELLLARDKRWLTKAGITVKDGVKVEISPLLGLSAEEVAQNVKPGEIEADLYLSIGD
jgi:UDP-N-acetylglucosamine/UDP-N-acetylgalactosamine diphosphorylase